MRIAAVVVTFNRLILLKKVIESLNGQTVKLDTIIVVDNGSTDGTREWLSKEMALKVIRQENIGGSGGFYTGIKYAYEHGFDWIWCMDDDVYPRPDCLRNLLEHDRDMVGILCPKRTQGGNDIGREVIKMNLANPFSGIGKILLEDISDKDRVVEIEGMSFEGPLIKREVVEKIGYPEKGFFLFYDDTDYSYRAVSEGYKVLHIPNAILNKEYFENTFSREEKVIRNKWRLKYHLRNTTYFCKKHGKNRFFKYCGSIRLYVYILGAICYNLPRNNKYTFKDIKMLVDMYSKGINGHLGKMS